MSDTTPRHVQVQRYPQLNILPLLGIDPRFLGHPASSLLPTLTELSRLHYLTSAGTIHIFSVFQTMHCSTLYRGEHCVSPLPPGRADKSAADCAVTEAHIYMLIASAGFAVTTAIMWP